MRIFIPSMGRVHAQLTWNAMPRAAHEEFNITVVCEPMEVPSLKLRGINAVAYKGRKKGIGAKRQWILEKFRDDPLMCMFDDDLNIWAQRMECDDGLTRYIKASDEQIVAGLREFADILSHSTAGSLGGRSFAQDRPVVERRPGRLLRALGYNLERMPPTAKFRLPTCEDLDMQLQLLEAGAELFMFNGLVQEQKGSNLAGGCSTYRDLDFQAEQYKKLHEFHPKFVKLVTRTYRRGWDGMSKTQPSVTINWRAAAAAGKRSKK